jgi:hypothetical protein
MKTVRILVGIGALAPVALALAPAAAHAATRSVPCGTAPNHWTELKNGGSTYCWGYAGGTWDDGLIIASKECGGNNYGWYSDSTSNTGHENFVEGTTFRTVKGGFITAMHISGWAGTDTCD